MKHTEQCVYAQQEQASEGREDCRLSPAQPGLCSGLHRPLQDHTALTLRDIQLIGQSNQGHSWLGNCRGESLPTGHISPP